MNDYINDPSFFMDKAALGELGKEIEDSIKSHIENEIINMLTFVSIDIPHSSSLIVSVGSESWTNNTPIGSIDPYVMAEMLYEGSFADLDKTQDLIAFNESLKSKAAFLEVVAERLLSRLVPNDEVAE